MSKLMKAAEMAEVLQVSEKTLTRWRAEGRGPEFLRLGEGRCAPVRYLPIQSVADIEKETQI